MRCPAPAPPMPPNAKMSNLYGNIDTTGAEHHPVSVLSGIPNIESACRFQVSRRECRLEFTGSERHRPGLQQDFISQMKTSWSSFATAVATPRRLPPPHPGLIQPRQLVPRPSILARPFYRQITTLPPASSSQWCGAPSSASHWIPQFPLASQSLSHCPRPCTAPQHCYRGKPLHRPSCMGFRIGCIAAIGLNTAFVVPLVARAPRTSPISARAAGSIGFRNPILHGSPSGCGPRAKRSPPRSMSPCLTPSPAAALRDGPRHILSQFRQNPLHAGDCKTHARRLPDYLVHPDQRKQRIHGIRPGNFFDANSTPGATHPPLYRTARRSSHGKQKRTPAARRLIVRVTVPPPPATRL